MHKHSIRILFLTLVVAGSVAMAEESLDKIFSANGSLRVRSEADENTDFATTRDYTTLRVRGDFTVTPEKSLRIFAQPQFSKYFGQQDYVPTSTTASSLTTTSSVNFDDSILMHQAYFDYSFSDTLSFEAGRMILSYGDELVIGANDWNYIGRSFDAFKMRWKYGLGWSDLFASKINDTNTATSSAGDNDFFGLYNGWTTDTFAKNIDLYVLYSRDARAGTQLNLDLWTYGARVKSSIDKFDYRVEGNIQNGLIAQTPTTGGLLDGEFGYTIEKLRLGLEGYTSSDQYNQLYPTGHKWLGYADVLARRNISGAALHLLSTSINDLKIELTYEAYYRTVASSPAYKFNGTALGQAAGSSALDIGAEADLTVKYKVSHALTAQSGLSYFQPGNYLRDQGLSVSPLFYYLQAETIF